MSGLIISKLLSDSLLLQNKVLDMLRQQMCNFRKNLCSKVLFSTSTPEEPTKVNPLIEKLSAEFGSVSDIKLALRQKELQNINFEEWKSRIYVLKRHNFSDADCFSMISSYPYLLKIPLEDFENSVKQWFLADLGFDNFQCLLQSQPELININVQDIRRRLPKLRIYFRSSKALCELLTTSPNIMFDNWESVVKKLNYVTKEKKFNMGDVLGSQVLSKSLDFIKFRFDLLEKCGIFRLENTSVHKINKYDKTKYKNPSLKDILNPNDLKFIELAKISHEEYSVCESLYYEKDMEVEDEEEENGYN